MIVIYNLLYLINDCIIHNLITLYTCCQKHSQYKNDINYVIKSEDDHFSFNNIIC